MIAGRHNFVDKRMEIDLNALFLDKAVQEHIQILATKRLRVAQTDIIAAELLHAAAFDLGVNTLRVEGRLHEVVAVFHIAGRNIAAKERTFFQQQHLRPVARGGNGRADAGRPAADNEYVDGLFDL